jgi:hypothetical protein
VLEVAFIAVVVTLFLVWPVFATHRRQQQGFAAAVDAIIDEPPTRSSTTATAELVSGEAPDRAKALKKLQEAELELIAISGRLDVALRVGVHRVDSLRAELVAADTALASIDATLRSVVALAGISKPIPRFEGLSHELPTSLTFGVARVPDSPYALSGALEQRQIEAAFGQLRIAEARARQLEQQRKELTDALSRPLEGSSGERTFPQ